MSPVLPVPTINHEGTYSEIPHDRPEANMAMDDKSKNINKDRRNLIKAVAASTTIIGAPDVIASMVSFAIIGGSALAYYLLQRRST